MKTAGLGSVARSTERRQQTRDLVLDTALRLFNEHGYLGVRVEDIAQQAGVSRATFYKHFAEREQVLAELFERLLGPGSEATPPASPEAPGSATIEELVVAAVEDAVQRMLAQQDLARFVYSLPVRHSALLRPEVRTTPPCSSKSPTCSSGGCTGARSATTSPSTSSPATSSRPWRRRCATGPRAGSRTRWRTCGSCSP